MGHDWDSLSTRERGVLERLDIYSVAEFIQAIETWGLGKISDGIYYFRSYDAPSFRGAGTKTWRVYTDLLDAAGFDWRAHLSRGRRPRGQDVTQYADAEVVDALGAKIDELIALLEEFKRRAA